MLRLTFHDCLKYDDGTGGCDGCLNWSGVGIRYNGAENKRKYPDVGFTDNNGLRHTVEILEAIYQVICMSIRLCLNMKYNNNNDNQVKSFPNGAPTLASSLRESGKSRADLWALAGIVAVEFGIEKNNRKCRDPSVPGCHHLQGEPDCAITLNTTIPFR